MSTGATVALRMSAAGTAYSRSPSSCVKIEFQTSHAVDAMMAWRLIFYTGSDIGNIVFVSRQRRRDGAGIPRHIALKPGVDPVEGLE